MRFLILIFIPICLCSCSPSAIILVNAPNEERIFRHDSTREQIENKLGEAQFEYDYNPPVKLYDFRFPEVTLNKNCKIERQQIGSPPYTYIPKPDDPLRVAVRCRYKNVGKIIRQGRAGDSNALAFMTFGISEIFNVPDAISEVSSDAPIQNTFDVWYSPEGKLLAYSWRACEPDNDM